MKIAVCVKQVPDAPTKRIDPATKRLDRSGEGTLNAFDANAVEEALRLKESGGDGEVVLVSMGPASAADALRKALAMGADRALLSPTTAAAGSDLLGDQRALAAALERESPELMLFGQYAGDSEGAVLWAAVAERLRRPMISQVAELTVEDGAVRGRRQTEFGYDVIRAPLPAVVAVSDAINEPRYPSLKGIMGAKKKPQDSCRSPISVSTPARPARRARARRVLGAQGSAAPRRPAPHRRRRRAGADRGVPGGEAAPVSQVTVCYKAESAA